MGHWHLLVAFGRDRSNPSSTIPGEQILAPSFSVVYQCCFSHRRGALVCCAHLSSANKIQYFQAQHPGGPASSFHIQGAGHPLLPTILHEHQSHCPSAVFALSIALRFHSWLPVLQYHGGTFLRWQGAAFLVGLGQDGSSPTSIIPPWQRWCLLLCC